MANRRDTKNQTKGVLTMLDVANHAGVAPATVSRVTNQRSCVSEETRMKVNRAIRELGYSLPNNALRVRSLTLPNIMVIYNKVTTDIHSNKVTVSIVRGIQDAVSNLGAHIYFIAEEHGIPAKESLTHALYSHTDINGIMLMGILRDDERLQYLKEERVPFIVINQPIDEESVSYVSPENVVGAELAIEHLIKMGHRRIIFSSSTLNHGSALERLHGYKKTLAKHGIKESQELINVGPLEDVIERLLSLPEPPTAMFVTNDSLASGAIQKMKAAGLCIPEDFAAVGFDDLDYEYEEGKFFTSVDYPKYEMGLLATRNLVEMINGKVSQIRIRVKPNLVVRDSCGGERGVHFKE